MHSYTIIRLRITNIHGWNGMEKNDTESQQIRVNDIIRVTYVNLNSCV